MIYVVKCDQRLSTKTERREISLYFSWGNLLPLGGANLRRTRTFPIATLLTSYSTQLNTLLPTPNRPLCKMLNMVCTELACCSQDPPSVPCSVARVTGKFASQRSPSYTFLTEL